MLRQLAVWGAPTDLLRELGCRPAGGGDTAAEQHLPADLDPDPNPDRRSQGAGRGGPASSPSSWPRCRSRPLLLALGWLAAAAGLFERRIGELEPGPALRALLPPYPQVRFTSTTICELPYSLPTRLCGARATGSTRCVLCCAVLSVRRALITLDVSPAPGV